MADLFSVLNIRILSLYFCFEFRISCFGFKNASQSKPMISYLKPLTRMPAHLYVTAMQNARKHDRATAVNLIDLDRATPGEVYLCQAGPTVSCGACCGLYNVKDLSRETLTRMLEDQTERFAKVPRTIEAIDHFAGDTFFRVEGRQQPIPDFHHCPFLGLISPENRTVGCLLHPLAEGNAGVDWRGLSYYGGFACATYFCPTCHELPPRYKRLIRQAADHWYDYGLMITETELLATFLSRVENRLGRPVDDRELEQRPAATTRIREFLAIKNTWPFRDPARQHLTHFFFNKKEYQPPAIGLQCPGAETSPWAPVLTALWSVLPSPVILTEAEALLDRMADGVAIALK